jgi:hypothetical protein
VPVNQLWPYGGVASMLYVCVYDQIHLRLRLMLFVHPSSEGAADPLSFSFGGTERSYS